MLAAIINLKRVYAIYGLDSGFSFPSHPTKRIIFKKCSAIVAGLKTRRKRQIAALVGASPPREVFFKMVFYEE